MKERKQRDLFARVMNIEYGGIWSMYWAYYGVLLSFGSVYLIGATMAPGEAVKGQTWYVVSTTVASVLASFAGGWILDLAGAKALCLVGLVLAAAGCLIFFLIVDKVAAGNHEA